MGVHEKELDEAIEVLNTKVTTAFAKYEGEVEEFGKASKASSDNIKALTGDFDAMVIEAKATEDRLKELEQKQADGFKAATPELTTWGQDFIASDSFKNFGEGLIGRAKIEVNNNTIIGESGSPQEPSNVVVQADRLAGIVPGAFRSLNVLDFTNTGVTGSNQIEYTRELAWTNNSAETSEGVAKPESVLTFELVQDPVRTIAHFIKASKQILDDAPMLSSYIDRRMEHGVRKRLQTQVLKGNGTTPNITGLDQTGRHTAFTPATGDNALDSLSKAKYNVIGADYDPNFIFMNPSDFGAIERLKVSSSDDRYLASDGAALAYINGGMTPMIWGLPVISTNDVASGKFYLGDSNSFQLFMRQAMTLEMFEQDEDNVQKNLLTIRAELRAALAMYTPAALQYGSLRL